MYLVLYSVTHAPTRGFYAFGVQRPYRGAERIMTGEMRTLAAQIPAELFDRLDRYLKERGIKKKDFLVDIITRALEAAEATEPVTEASPQDELEEQPEADET